MTRIPFLCCMGLNSSGMEQWIMRVGLFLDAHAAQTDVRGLAFGQMQGELAPHVRMRDCEF